MYITYTILWSRCTEFIHISGKAKSINSESSEELKKCSEDTSISTIYSIAIYKAFKSLYQTLSNAHGNIVIGAELRIILPIEWSEASHMMDRDATACVPPRKAKHRGVYGIMK